MTNSKNIFVMDAKTKQDFDSWLKANYPKLYKDFIDTDSLHDAYIIVASLNKLHHDRYGDAIQRAYLIKRRQYIKYLCTFIFPEPLFWLYQAIEEADEFYDDIISQEKQSESAEKQKQQSLTNFAKWVKNNYTGNEYNIFRMYYYENLEFNDIAKLSGLSKNTITNIINDMCDVYKKNKNNKQAKNNILQ